MRWESVADLGYRVPNERFFVRDDTSTPAIEERTWRLRGHGAIGITRWRGVPLRVVLERAGISPSPVDVMPAGLDPTVVAGGVDYGHVRRPLPVEKVLDDVLVALSMNGADLPPDHGFPA